MTLPFNIVHKNILVLSLKSNLTLQHMCYFCFVVDTFTNKYKFSLVNVVLAHPGDGSPRRGYPLIRDLNAEESSTNEPHVQTSIFIGTSFSCRAERSNPGPLEIAILQ